MNIKRYALFALTLAVTAPTISAAALLDLTAPGSSASVNGALFIVPENDIVAGSGVFNTFLAVAAQGQATTTQGYNTADRAKGNPKTQFDEDNGKTKDLLLSAVPVVTVNGIQYREFALDINEPNNTTHLLSLDRLQLFSGPDILTTLTSYSSPGNTSPLATLTGGAVGDPVLSAFYSLDSATDDNWLRLDADLFPGSGKADLLVLIPAGLFVGPSVYLYSRFGDNVAADSGFEEFGIAAVNPCPPGNTIAVCEEPPEEAPPGNNVPEPVSLALIGLGLAALAVRRRKAL